MQYFPWLSNFLPRSVSFFLPQHCLFCREKTNRRIALCTHCSQALPHNYSHCCRCSLPLPQAGHLSQQLCGNCLSHRYAYDQVYSPFLYNEGIRYLIRQFKYHNKLHYSTVLATLFHEALRHRLQLPQVFIPMPMHQARMRQRGFNQALELARLFSRYFQIPMDTQALIRTRHTALQAGLSSRERQKNVHQAFALQQALPYRHVALVDDVMTTGCTVNAAAHALKAGGIEQVDIWCIARARAGN